MTATELVVLMAVAPLIGALGGLTVFYLSRDEKPKQEG